MSRARRVAAAALLAAVLTACGGGGSDGGSGQPATAEGLESFVRESAPKILKAEEDTYDLLSAECRERFTETEWRAQVTLAAGFLEAFGLEADAISVGEVVTRDVTATEGEASVEILVDGAPFGEEEGFSSDPTFDRYVYEDGAWRLTSCDDLSGSGDDGESAGPAEGEPGSRTAPLALGTTAAVGDYDVRVVEVGPDATTEILEAQGYGELPAEGNVHALVRLQVTYTGEEEGSPGFDLTVGIAGSDNRSYDSCEVSPPESMFDEPDLLTGGQAEGTFCVTLPGDQAAEGLVFVEEGFGFDDAKIWWEQQG
jgi:hypothetical protein